MLLVKTDTPTHKNAEHIADALLNANKAVGCDIFECDTRYAWGKQRYTQKFYQLEIVGAPEDMDEIVRIIKEMNVDPYPLIIITPLIGGDFAEGWIQQKEKLDVQQLIPIPESERDYPEQTEF